MRKPPQAANSVGYGGASHEEILKKALVPPKTYSHFVELHIEQVRTPPLCLSWMGNSCIQCHFLA